MNAEKDHPSQTPGWAAEAREWIRAEPALAWFLSQAVYLAQPVLEAFWPAGDIERLAGELSRPEPRIPGDDQEENGPIP
jgi:hypothetical protein